jgi:hypothetical protein
VQFWQNHCQATESDSCDEYDETIFDENEGVPKPFHAWNSPPAKQKARAGDKQSENDEKLVAVLNKTEMMVLHFHQGCGLLHGGSRRSWACWDILALNPYFYRAPPSSTCCGTWAALRGNSNDSVQLLAAMGRKSNIGVGKSMVIRDYLVFFREIMRDLLAPGQRFFTLPGAPRLEILLNAV